MEHPFSITIPQLIERYGVDEKLNNDFIISSRVIEYIDVLSFPLRIDAFMVGICVKGSMKISVNTQEWVITENTCFVNLPENVVGVGEIAHDTEGYVLLISMDYLRKMNINLKSILPYYTLIRSYPCFDFQEHEMKRIKQFFELITECLQDEESIRKEEIIKGLFSALVFKMCESLDRVNYAKGNLKTKSKEYYFVKFMELLRKDFREHRNVGYYSDKLAITPKYLSLLIKNISGTSAADWIDEYTIAEASILLKFSDKNIKEIADELNFPSQSFFSKYFKQHTGYTPSEYRESLLINLSDKAHAAQ